MALWDDPRLSDRDTMIRHIQIGDARIRELEAALALLRGSYQQAEAELAAAKKRIATLEADVALAGLALDNAEVRADDVLESLEEDRRRNAVLIHPCKATGHFLSKSSHYCCRCGAAREVALEQGATEQ